MLQIRPSFSYSFTFTLTFACVEIVCVWSRPSIEHRVPWDCDCLNIKWVGRTLCTMPAGLGRAWPDLANKGYARYVVGSWNYSLHSTHKLDAHNKGIRMRTSHHHHPQPSPSPPSSSSSYSSWWSTVAVRQQRLANTIICLLFRFVPRTINAHAHTRKYYI